MATEPATCRHYRIRGRVQGVGFRHFVWREATERGMRGWVRNRRDGSVEAFARADSAALDAFELVLSRGPRWGRVDELTKSDVEQPGEALTVFEIRSTM